jgi:hypothetical protein
MGVDYFVLLEIKLNVPYRLKSRCWQPCIPPADSEGESLPLSFLASRECLHSFAHDLFHLQSPCFQPHLSLLHYLVSLSYLLLTKALVIPLSRV